MPDPNPESFLFVVALLSPAPKAKRDLARKNLPLGGLFSGVSNSGKADAKAEAKPDAEPDAKTDANWVPY